ncbi:MAG: hypothetical protein AAB250_06650 [Bdellovibrionota bacterium]
MITPQQPDLKFPGSHKTITFLAFGYFVSTAIVFAVTFFLVFYTSLYSSGDNLGAGPVAMATLVLFLWSLIAFKCVRGISRQWVYLSPLNRAVKSGLILSVFALPTGFFAWFAIYLIFSYLSA